MRIKIKKTGALLEEIHASVMYGEMRSVSITPTSFYYREFEDDITEPTYLESYFSGKVIRFGINAATLSPEV